MTWDVLNMIPSDCVGEDLLLSKVVVLQRGVYTWFSVPGRGCIISGYFAASHSVTKKNDNKPN